MLDISFVSGLTETIYGFHPVDIKSLQQDSFDWRGIFSLREKNGQRWVLRLLNRAGAAEGFHATATVLEWLNRRHYSAPRVRRTRAAQLVGIRNDWALLLLSFIEGKVILPTPSDLRLLSARLGQLHALPHDSAPVTRLSRCHPEMIATRTLVQLDAGSPSAPEMYAPLFRSLGDSMRRVIKLDSQSLRITHGDCWYMNAVKTETHDVTLIDWDNVGIGLAALDLGYLLLSSHFLLEAPFSMHPDRKKVQAIMDGYQRQYDLGRQEIDSLLQAVHFPLAYHLGMYCENNTHLQEEDLFLMKTKLRFNHAAMVAQMAEAYAKET